MRKMIIILITAALLSACTSKPYVTKQVIDKEAGTKTETICTHKVYLIPWYVGVAGGIIKFNGDKTCEDKTMDLEEETEGEETE